MKLSELSKNDLFSLTCDQAEAIVFGGDELADPNADVALLLGCPPEISKARAEAAARLYIDGKVRYIVPSGGVLWEHEGKMLSEADFMAEVLISLGVPAEAIVKDNEARTTKENMICGALVINRAINFYNVKRVCIVTSSFHMRRSLALAKTFLPRTVEIVGYPDEPIPEAKINSRVCEELMENVKREIPLLHSLVEHGMIDDIEF